MHSIDLKRLEHPAVKSYLITADRRTKAGARFVFDKLDIPMPDYLARKPAGRPYGHIVMAAYRADNPETLHEASMRKNREYAARRP